MLELLDCIERIENGSDSATLNFLRTFRELVNKQETIIQEQRFMFNAQCILIFTILVIVVGMNIYNWRK